MNDEDFEAWKICWRVNLAFHVSVHKPQKCIVCSQVVEHFITARRSILWLEATRCSAGHRQVKNEEMEGAIGLGVCETCDQTYMLDVLKGRIKCRRKPCQRTVRIHQAEVRRVLAYSHDEHLLLDFTSLMKRCNTYECLIHYDDEPFESESLSAYSPPTAKCNHDRNVGDRCLKDYFETAIHGGRFGDLKCPDSDCKQSIPFDRLRSLISAEVLKIYTKKLSLEALSKNEKFRWCSCGHGQIHELAESHAEWTCIQCNTKHCYICRDSSGSNCEHLRKITSQRLHDKAKLRSMASKVFQDSATNKIDAAARSALSRITKTCPKAGCSTPIERIEGCAHFTCRKCKTEFCWVCKVIWPNGKALHLNTCRLASKSQVPRSRLALSDYAAGWDQDKDYDVSLDSDRGLRLIASQQ